MKDYIYKIIGTVLLVSYIIFMVVFIILKCKTIEHFNSITNQTFYYTLIKNKNIKILSISHSIQYNNINITGLIGQNILYKIYSKLENKEYILLRYPDFRNEVKRHSASYINSFFTYLNHSFIDPHKNYIFDFTGFHGIIDNKVRLWIKLKETFDRKTANTIMGTTYLIPNDKKLFLDNYMNSDRKYNGGRKYILKNSFGGARSALEITTNKDTILHYFNTTYQNPAECKDAVCHSKVKYNIVQDYIEPTFLMKGLKFGLRMYLIITCNNKMNSYIYKDGNCYYSESAYNKTTTDLSQNVVGSIFKTQDIRKKNNLPESYKDFEKYIRKNENNSTTKLNNFKTKLQEYCKKIIESNKDELCIFNKQNIKSYVIYAMDIEIDRDFTPYIFEANVYFPRFTMKERLGGMISNMYNDIYYKLGLSNTNINGMWEL